MLNLDTNKRSLYRGHVLSCRPLLQDDGRYQARVAITSLGGDKTLSQRFLDLESFASKEEAISKAHLAGLAWVDRDWEKRGVETDDHCPQAPSIHAERSAPI